MTNDKDGAALLREADVMIGNFIAQYDEGAQGCMMDADDAQALAREFKRMQGLIYCPGVLRCAKCDFRLIKTTLCISDGNAYANNDPDTCPNCNVPMWRVTWQDEAKEAYKTAESQMDRAIEAERSLATLKSHGQAFDAAGVREACANVADAVAKGLADAENAGSDEAEEAWHSGCAHGAKRAADQIRALPIPEAPTSVEPVAVQPIATAPIGEYVLFHFDGPFNDTECPGVSIGKKCADGRYWLTAIWASSTSHHDPVGWSPIPQSSRPEPDTIGSRSPGFGGGDLREALTDMCAAMEYWAGCDEGCSEDEAASEIMSSGGAWPATSYEQARKALASLPPVKQSVGDE